MLHIFRIYILIIDYLYLFKILVIFFLNIPGSMYLIYREISYQKHKSFLSSFTVLDADISVGFMITFILM